MPPAAVSVVAEGTMAVGAHERTGPLRQSGLQTGFILPKCEHFDFKFAAITEPPTKPIGRLDLV